MRIIFEISARKELDFWTKSGNKQVLKKIYRLIEDIQKHPFKGIGKPEALKYELSGKWSRRITREHRIVYEVSRDSIIVYSLNDHYEKK